jgi:activating signal cointegrator complex subunit 2
MQDRTWLQEMKAEIIRRAEADSGDEEEEPRYRTERRRMIPVEDDFDEFEDSVGNVSVAGDGEGTGSEDEEEKESVSTTHCSHQLLSIGG